MQSRLSFQSGAFVQVLATSGTYSSRLDPSSLIPDVRAGIRASRLASFQVGQKCIRAVHAAQRQHKGRILAPFSSHQSWDGNLSQQELLLRDQCILVDEDDNIVGNASKRDSHSFDKQHPEGLLHRAFSVFLFDDDDRLLLQQRAAGKVTFPSVWTNTCCSHPLMGQHPPEVDSPADIKSGSVPGVKHAAVRKLKQELGICPDQLPMEDFRLQQYEMWQNAVSRSAVSAAGGIMDCVMHRFLTRLHYCAADPSHDGKQSQWGEHEVDHILFIKAQVHVKPNAEEVSDHKYVTQQELREMVDPKSGLQWSPWFRIIASQFLRTWWDDLPKALNTNKYVDTITVHKLDA